SLQKITPFLWYSKEAEEASAFYASVFPDSRITRVTTMPSESPSGPWFGENRRVPPFRAALCRHERWPARSLQPCCVIRRELRRSGRDRPLLECTSRGRLGGAVRLAEGSLRPLMADRTNRSRRDDGRS